MYRINSYLVDYGCIKNKFIQECKIFLYKFLQYPPLNQYEFIILVAYHAYKNKSCLIQLDNYQVMYVIVWLN